MAICSTVKFSSVRNDILVYRYVSMCIIYILLICHPTLKIHRPKNRNWLAYNLNRQALFVFPYTSRSPTVISLQSLRAFQSVSRSKMTFKTRVQGSLGELGISSDRGLSLWANSISGPNQIPCAAFTYRSQNPQSSSCGIHPFPSSYIRIYILNQTFCSQNRDRTIPFSDMSCRVNTYSCPCSIFRQQVSQML